MFSECSSLQSLNLLSFKTENVYSFASMFENCNSLISLDLENFVNSKAVFLNNMFRNCKSLEYINIRNIKGSNNNSSYYCQKYHTTEYCSTTHGMFSGCTNLKFVNIFSLLQLLFYSDMFQYITSNFTYCIDNQTEILNIIKQFTKAQRDCSEKCYEQRHILLSRTNKCVIECNKTDNKIYAYKEDCHEKCPKRTKISEEYNFTCEDIICEKYYNFGETGCVDEIPEGYYLKDETLKTIDQCHNDCKSCYGQEIY